MSVVCKKRNSVEDDIRRGEIEGVNPSIACIYGVCVWCENMKVGMRELSRGEQNNGLIN